MQALRNLNAAYDMALRVGRGAARDYVARRRDVAPERQEEFLGCFIVGLEDTLAGMIPSENGAFADILDAAIEAFVAEADRWPAPAADPERLFDFENLVA
ncbi:hypothetical protein [Methylocystis echinoides]|jgi:hypothetical protein|uniref:hypothetical protein n=1 Tax=Methylocystis echinoides TaxID=29468 RepID=UPI00342ECC62